MAFQTILASHTIKAIVIELNVSKNNNSLYMIEKWRNMPDQQRREMSELIAMQFCRALELDDESSSNDDDRN